MKTILTILVFVIVVLPVYAQGEADNWYFGEYCAMTFNTPDKSPRFLPGSQMQTDEGCASISDYKGNLLFYTNGKTVWNSENVKMPNGENLYGHESSTQSGVIIKKPASENLYYIFTVDRQGGYYGLRYSIVDMNKDFGRGDIISKNNFLRLPVAEKITAIRHKNGNSIWIIAHDWGNNNFISYLLTKDGLNTAPVVCSVGTSYDGDNMNAGGYMKASPDGRYVASAVYWDGVFEILRFDNSSGLLAEPITFKSPDYKYIYGVEFSADASKVYFSKSYEPSAIFQVDLKAGNDFDIINSIVTVAQSQSYFVFQALQIAPDKKIYVAKRNKTYLSVIESPNEKGSACGFKDYGFDLLGRTCNAGLPTFNQSFLDLYIEIFGETELCEGDTLKLSSSQYDDATYKWECPDGSIYNSPKLVIPDMKIENSGYYKFTLFHEDLEKSDSVFVLVSPKPHALIIPADTAYMCNDESVVLSAGSQGDDLLYKWSTGEETASIEVFESGLYSLIVTNANNCSDTAYVYVIHRDAPLVHIVKHGYEKLCPGEEIVLSTEKKYLDYKWSTGETDSSITVSQPGIYSVNVVDKYGCRGSDTVEIEKYDVNFTHFADIDFGKILIGNTETRTIEFVNNGTDSIYVTNISQILNTNEFELSYSPSLPVWLKTNEKITISIRFSPETDNIFLDSISIIVAFPCGDEQIFQVSGYSAEESSIVWLPDTTGKIGDSKFIIPLYAKLFEKDTLHLSFTADIAFNAEIFLPDDNQDAIVDNQIINGMRKLKLKGDNLFISNSDVLLVGIKGTVLLSSGRFPLIIENFEWNTPYVQIDTNNGSLRAGGVCQPALSKIILSEQKKLFVYPNPANEFLNIETKENNIIINKIEVYNYKGKLIYTYKTIKKVNENTYKIDVSALEQGNYIFVFYCNCGKLYEHIAIVR
jgi:hypothetical protein